MHAVTDRGTQFESELSSELFSIIGFHHLRTTSYHPQANGIIERHHRSLKSAISARQENWFYALPIVLLGYRMPPNVITYSPFTAVTGAHILCPSVVITREQPVITSKDTIQQFINEMQTINFYELTTGVCHSGPKTYVPKISSLVQRFGYALTRLRRV